MRKVIFLLQILGVNRNIRFHFEKLNWRQQETVTRKNGQKEVRQKIINPH